MKTGRGPPYLLIKSGSDPNIKRLPSRFYTKVLGQFIYRILNRFSKSPKITSIIIAEFICALRKSNWLMSLFSKFNSEK
jgi:hypothetical protein